MMTSPSGRQELSCLICNIMSLLARPRHWSFSFRTESDVRICLRSIVLLSTWIRVRSGVVPSFLPIIFLYAFFISQSCYLSLPSFPLCLSPDDFNPIIYNKPTRCNSGSIVFINNYKYALHFGHGIVQCAPTLTSIQDLFRPNSWQTPLAAVTVYSAPDDGRKGRPKHVEHTCSC